MIETLAWACVYGAWVLGLLLMTGCLSGLERWSQRHSERWRDGAFIPQEQIDALVSSLARRINGDVGAKTTMGTPEDLPYSMTQDRKR
jgi:hypothetical protein